MLGWAGHSQHNTSSFPRSVSRFVIFSSHFCLFEDFKDVFERVLLEQIGFSLALALVVSFGIFHIKTAPSALPVIMNRPHGLNFPTVITAACPYPAAKCTPS